MKIIYITYYYIILLYIKYIIKFTTSYIVICDKRCKQKTKLGHAVSWVAVAMESLAAASGLNFSNTFPRPPFGAFYM